MVVWRLANAGVSFVVLAVLTRSRIQKRAAWSRLDFIKKHAPKNGRPPKMIEEYRAQPLKVEQ
jgi:hypothetical protein